MKNTEHKPILVARIFLFVIYFIGIIGISIPSLRGLYAPLTPYTLLISAVILFAFHGSWNLRFAGAIILIALAGFAVEAIGVHTGVVFGEYSYGPVLGLKVAEIPAIIALNWAILIYCSYFLAERISQKVLLKLAITAILMVGMDFLIEPVAIALDMWSWEASVPPLQNYAAWFAISFLFAGVFHIMKVKTLNPLAVYLFLFLVMFFGTLNLTL
ncbi:MAG: carotenoid biosynthesis protein [Bacteroidales bacterium]|nr:carotenoid biosynthesis protein [Bacteroidales bacterium]